MRSRSALAGVLIAVVSACISPSPQVQSPSPSASAGGPAVGGPGSGGRVVVGDTAEAKVLNPVLATDFPSATVITMLYASLVTVDAATGEARPNLAEKWTVSLDGMSYVFTLRDGLVWSDGSPFTGEDFKVTVEAVMRSAKTTRKDIFQYVAGAKQFADGTAADIAGIAVRGREITVRLEKPFCPALTGIGTFAIIPRSVFGRYLDPADRARNVDDAVENTKPTISMGPFVFKEWVPNDHITLTRNARYFKGPPLLEEITFKLLPDAPALVSALRSGQVDVASVDPADRDGLVAAGTLDLYRVGGRSYTYIGWNELRGGKEFFQDRAVRQALAYGLDMDAVIDQVLLGEGTRQVVHSLPVYWSYDGAGLNTYGFDAKKAADLLEGDGWRRGIDGIYAKNGTRLSFSIVTNSDNKVRQRLLQFATDQYKQIGIEVEPKVESFEALVDRVTKSKDPTYGGKGGHDYDAVILGWSLGTDPDGYSVWHSSQIDGGYDFVGYGNDVVDKALEDGRTMCQPDQRKAAYKTFDRELNEDQPYNFGFAPNTLVFVNERFDGPAPGPFGGASGAGLAFWNIETWRVAR